MEVLDEEWPLLKDGVQETTFDLLGFTIILVLHFCFCPCAPQILYMSLCFHVCKTCNQPAFGNQTLNSESAVNS